MKIAIGLQMGCHLSRLTANKPKKEVTYKQSKLRQPLGDHFKTQKHRWYKQFHEFCNVHFEIN